MHIGKLQDFLKYVQNLKLKLIVQKSLLMKLETHK